MNFKFPKGFYWGAATSSHQVEGGNYNDWSVWEKENAERLAMEAEREFGYFKNWPKIKEIEHYRQVIKVLRAQGIEPFVGLWHWPIPLLFMGSRMVVLSKKAT